MNLVDKYIQEVYSVQEFPYVYYNNGILQWKTRGKKIRNIVIDMKIEYYGNILSKNNKIAHYGARFLFKKDSTIELYCSDISSEYHPYSNGIYTLVCYCHSFEITFYIERLM